MATDKAKPKRKSQRVATSHEDELLPPACAAAQASREADLRQFVTGDMVKRMQNSIKRSK